MTLVVNKHTHTPTDNDVYIGRGSRWGNDFTHSKNTKARYLVGSREEAIACYKRELWATMKEAGEGFWNALADLHGKTLVCYCKPQACHGDVLAAAAEYAHKARLEEDEFQRQAQEAEIRAELAVPQHLIW